MATDDEEYICMQDFSSTDIGVIDNYRRLMVLEAARPTVK